MNAKIVAGNTDPRAGYPGVFDPGFILRVSLAAAMGGLLFGYDTAIISGVIPFIKTYFQLDAAGLGWAVGCILAGCAAGAVLAGRLMDRMGRRWVLIACSVVFALSGLGAGLATAEWVFVAFRISGGLAVGAAAMVSPVYIAEIAPSARRGRLVSVYQLAILSGILLAYFANYLLADMGEDSWRWMLASQLLPAFLFFGCLLGVPETPRWLVQQRQDQRALQVLTQAGGEPFARAELMHIQQSFRQDPPGRISTLFSSRYRKVMGTGILVAVFQQVTGINAILYYAPVIFKETGIGRSDALLQTIGIGVVNLAATFMAIGLVDRLGRKIFLLYGSVLMGLSLAGVALCFHFQYFGHYIVLAFTLVYVAAFGCTLGAVTWVYLSEIFPNRIRALAISAATLALWLADFAVTYTFPLLAQRLGTSLTLSVYAGCCVLSAVYVWTRVPETKGRTLEEIETLFI